MTRGDFAKRLAEELERPPFNSWLAVVPTRVVEHDRVVELTLPFRPEFSLDRNNAIFHGGILAALADVTGHAAVAVFHGAPTPTINLQVEYLAPARGDAVRARGILRKLGRAISTADVELFCGDTLVALGRGNFSTKERANADSGNLAFGTANPQQVPRLGGI